MTTLPTWAVFAVSFGTPVLTLAGVLVAQAITRRGALELETRSRREETMRTMRWAAELSMRDDDRLAKLGVSELDALLDSDLLEESEKVFIEAALDAVYDDVEAELDQLGDDVEVVQYVDAPEQAVGKGSSGRVSLQQHPERGGDDHG